MTNEEAKKRLGNNIKALRVAWGEKQEDLAYAIGLISETSNNSRLSNYENGTRYPKPEIITRIAKHYRITEHELMYGDFSDSTVIPLTKVQDIEVVEQTLNVLFPMKVTESALENKKFSKAYKIHRKLYNCLVNKIEFDETDTDICSELYKEAFDEGVLEAAANHMSLILLIGYSLYVITPELCENIECMDVEISNLSDLLKYGFLPNFTDNAQEEYDEIDDLRTEYVHQNNKTILTYINKLKYSREYPSLGDYFLSLRQMFGLVNNSLSLEMNNTIGYEMLRSFSSIGNRYARNLIEMEKKFLKNE